MKSKKLTFMTFWAINDTPDSEKMKRQLEEMKALGFDGTVFQPRNYPGYPPYLGSGYCRILSEVILYAKELGLAFWIYDENGWPSGNADGRVAGQFPQMRCRWLEYGDRGVVCKERTGVNTLDRAAMAYFVEVTYDGYRRGLSEEAWNYVTGFFSDEVGFLDGHGASVSLGGVPWCEEIDECFLKNHGQKASDSWHLLFTEEEGYEGYRSRYWEILAGILAESFYDPVNQWCARHGKRYTAHLKGEENLFFQVPYSGSAFRNLQCVNLPAVDALERYPGNHYFPRIVSSLSRQFSDGECLAEAIGGSGWGLTPEQFEDYVAWLAGCGITQYVFHLSQYRLNSEAVRDWPPSLPFHMNWKPVFKELLGRLKDQYCRTAGKEPRLLLIAPVRGVMRDFHPVDAMALNEHNGSGTPDTVSGRISLGFERFVEHCYRMGMEFDVTEERILEEYGRIEDGKLRIGHGEYEMAVAGEGCFWEAEGIWKELCLAGIGLDAGVLVWSRLSAGKNQLLLSWPEESGTAGGSCFSCCVETDFEKAHDEMCLLLLDEGKEVCVNGIPCVVRQDDSDGSGRYVASLPQGLPARLNIDVTLSHAPELPPFVWLQGDFLVMSDCGYTEKDSHQVRTEGAFRLTDREPQERQAADLIAAGYPFMNQTVTVYCMAWVPESGEIALGTVYADLVFVRVDGREYGYLWGPEYRLCGLSPGLHRIDADLYPSTFNTYGPHHHIDGDRHLTSPFQFSGRKCFADRADAPEYTLVPEWHFVKFGIL